MIFSNHQNSFGFSVSVTDKIIESFTFLGMKLTLMCFPGIFDNLKPIVLFAGVPT